VSGLTHEQVYALGIAGWVERVHPEDQEPLEAALDAVYDSGTPMDLEYRLERDGRYVWLHTRARVVTGFDGNPEVEGITSDVTERKRLEAEFRQAQRMDAVGQLAGGVAHDFNNILAIILANTGFLLADMHESDPRRADAEEVKQAAERAAGLTRQLLAFSRQQMLEQRVLELNSVVAATEKMLRRLIGEDIELVTRLGPDAGAVKADIGQIEQVIMNLVVNARDAMPHGGRLIIETRPHEIATDVVVDGVPVPAGTYVLLTVTDAGTGMDRETQRRIFEPFFTTKERGRGTGLGLSTCYGIVKQSGGYIFVTSELGRGTIFRIYLPRVEEAPEPIAAPTPASIEITAINTSSGVAPTRIQK